MVLENTLESPLNCKEILKELLLPENAAWVGHISLGLGWPICGGSQEGTKSKGHCVLLMFSVSCLQLSARSHKFVYTLSLIYMNLNYYGLNFCYNAI